MAWFKVDDRVPSHPKFKRIPRETRLAASGLWMHAGAWASSFETDGNVPGYIVDDLGGSDDLVDALVAVGLWTRTADGIRFHDWADFQPTKAVKDAAREATAERVRKHRQRKRETGTKEQKRNGVTGRYGALQGVTGRYTPESETPDSGPTERYTTPQNHGATSGNDNGVTPPAVTHVKQRPDPTRPDPVTTPSSPPGDGSLFGGEEQPRTQKRAAYSPEFETAWKSYPAPGRQAKKVAAKAYASAVQRADPDAILAGIRRYAEYVEVTGTAVKWMQGWLNADRWEDENAVQAPRWNNGRPTAAENVASAWEVAARLAEQEQQEVSAGPNRRLSA